MTTDVLNKTWMGFYPLQEDGSQETEVQLCKVGRFHSPQYGEFEITLQDLEEMVANFENAPQKERVVDYNHASELTCAAAEEGKAAGWIKELFIEDDGLWAVVEWTNQARNYIKEGEYRYLSPVIQFSFKDKETGEEVGTRLKSAALVNQPFLEGMSPVQFQEILGVMMAEWTTAFINSLPDSSFAVIEPAYKRGKTKDKRARHLPFKDKNGKIDLPHYRNALARVNQIKPVTDSISREELIRRARAVLERHRKVLKTEQSELDQSSEEEVNEAMTDTKLLQDVEDLKKRITELEAENAALKAELAALKKVPASEAELLEAYTVASKENTALKAQLAALEDKMQREREGMVPVSVVEELKAARVAAEKQLYAVNRDIVLNEAIRNRKILPKEKAYWEGLYDKDPDATIKFLREKPVVYFQEIGSSAPSEGDRADQLLALARQKASERKISLSDAMIEVARENPDLVK